MMSRCVWSGTSANFPGTANPALFTKNSSVSNPEMQRSTRSMPSAAVKSATMNSARIACRCFSSDVSCFNRSARRATRMRSHPRAASSLANAAPIPLDAPVMRAILIIYELVSVTWLRQGSSNIVVAPRIAPADAPATRRFQQGKILAQRRRSLLCTVYKSDIYLICCSCLHPLQCLVQPIKQHLVQQCHVAELAVFFCAFFFREDTQRLGRLQRGVEHIYLLSRDKVVSCAVQNQSGLTDQPCRICERITLHLAYQFNRILCAKHPLGILDRPTQLAVEAHCHIEYGLDPSR